MREKTQWVSCVLAANLNVNQKAVAFIANFVCGLIAVRSVNWMEISQAMEGKAKPESTYKKIQRYFRYLVIPEQTWADFVLSCFPQSLYVLSLDRTNWQIGRKKINFLVLAVVVGHTSIPVFWMLLPKKGNSNSRERIDIIKKFVCHLGSARIAYLTADREFGSKQFIEYLVKNRIRFCIRVKKSDTIQMNGQTVALPIRVYLQQMRFKQTRVIETCCIWGSAVSVVLRREKEDSVVLITNFDPKRARKHYRKRWKIEELFQNLKSRGFNLETTHVTDLKRLHLLMGMLTVVYVWCYVLGEKSHQQKPIKRKKHGRFAKSLFREGLDQLRYAVFHFATKRHLLIALIHTLGKRLRKPFSAPVTYETIANTG